MSRKIAIGSDHRGFNAKGNLARFLQNAGFEVVDVGCMGPEGCDYPERAFAVGRLISTGECPLGLLICGSGIGMSIAANKVRGVRAAVVTDKHMAAMSRRHNNANVLCLSADMLSEGELLEILDAWLNATFEGGRHQRRLDAIAAYEGAAFDTSHVPTLSQSTTD